ncbi:MAG: lysophospholipid acyltransferase family protein [Alphaproteobacteria bacterium]
MRSPFRQFKNVIEYILARLFFTLMGWLPARQASNFGGWLGRSIGPYIGRTKLARRQMAEHLPHLSEAEREAAITAMWDNLGRTLCEYPHLAKGTLVPYLDISGVEFIAHAKASPTSMLFFTAHLGNWETMPLASALKGLKFHIVYRPPNNPLIDQLLDRIRMTYGAGHYGKGREGARGFMRAIAKGEAIGLVVDQKDNEGALLPFLGSPAMTMTSAAKLALKYRLMVIPARSIRRRGIEQEVIFYPPLVLPEGEDESAILALTQQFNDLISVWVREHPEQWFWLHRRWPKK